MGKALRQFLDDMGSFSFAQQLFGLEQMLRDNYVCLLHYALWVGNMNPCMPWQQTTWVYS